MENIKDTTTFADPGTLFEGRVSNIWSAEGSKMVLQSAFCKRFPNIPSDTLLFASVIWYLWRTNPKGILIDAENIRWGFTQICKDFDQMRIDHPDEYQEFLERVYEILDLLTKEYYSGIIGRMLARWDGFNLDKLNKQQDYKKLD